MISGKIKLTAIVMLLSATHFLTAQSYKEQLDYSGTGDLTMSLGRYRVGTMVNILFFVDGGWAQDGGEYHLAADWNGKFKVVYRGESSIAHRLRFYSYVDPQTQSYSYLFATWDNQSPSESYSNTVRFTISSNGDFNVNNTGTFSNASAANDVLVVQSGSEKVGIGTIYPDEKLEVNGSLLVAGRNLDGSDLSYLQNSRSLLIGWNRSRSHGETNFISNQGGGSVGGFDFRNFTNSGGESVLMKIQANGRIGIGNTSPASMLSIGSILSTARTNQGIILGRDQKSIELIHSESAAGYGSRIYGVDEGAGVTSMRIAVRGNSASWVNAVYIKASTGSNSGIGNVGIGTTNPDEKLTVNGTIHSSEVKVDLSVPGPDYVFESDYELRTLEETEEYIKENKHLPEIPSAEEMEANGVELGEMNMLLLKKIEELTLHLIEANEASKQQGKRVDDQAKKIEELVQYQNELLEKVISQQQRIEKLEKE